MPTPTQSYMALIGGADNAIYTGNQIKIGDNLKVSGTTHNDGNYTVLDIINSGSESVGSAGNDIYYVLKGRGITTETDTNKVLSLKITNGVGDKLVALGRADEVSNVNYGIDVWSYNDSTADSDGTPSLSENDGWTQSAINPTFKGNNSQYIFHFADEALRVCNTNEQNPSIIKWYGYIQRNQFGKNEGLSFSEWQEHHNLLSPPANAASISIGYLNGSSGNEHDGSDQATNFYNNNNRGVAYIIKGPGSGSATNIALDEAISSNETEFHFDDTVTDGVGQDQFYAGDVITIATALGAVPTEHLFCTKPVLDGTEVTFSRKYGGYGGSSTYSDNDSPVIKRGQAFNIGVTEDTTSGLWISGSWEFYQTFIYDGNQESLPVQVSDGASSLSAGTLNNTSGNLALKVSTFWDTGYNGRITGGRVYIREKSSSDPLTLFLDIDIVKGARTSMLDDHTLWSVEAGDGFYVSGLISAGPNIDTYASLNGFSSEEGFVSLGQQGDLYKTSVVSNRRVFIANVKHKNKNQESVKYGDRIMYSELNKFDTFLESNFIDVSKGDYGEYTALQSYSDRLLAFKHNLLHVINISNPSPTSWFLESTAKYSGVSYPFSVTKTEYGIAWVNEFGCFFYDGQKISNLLEGKLAINNNTESGSLDWATFVNGSGNIKDVMVGYDPLSNLLIVFRSPDNKTTHSEISYTYCFNTQGWTINNNMFIDSGSYTNFITDWNNNLVTGYQTDSNSVTFQKYLPVIKEQDEQIIITRDVDFGQPGIKKKIYKVLITYKSSEEQQTPLYYSIDGKKSFSTFSTGSNITPQGNSGGAGYLESSTAWDVATFVADSIVTCQSIQFKIAPPTSSTFEINDITVEYRVIKGATVL